MASILEAISKTVMETYEPAIKDARPRLDKTENMIRTTSIGVGRANFGREWKAKHTFVGGQAGINYSRSILGGTMPSAGASGNLLLYDDGSTSAGRTFPTIAEMPTPGFYDMEIQLKENVGGFAIPLQVFMYDKAGGNVGSVVSEVVRGAAEGYVMYEIHGRWKLNSVNNSICVIQAPSSSEDVTTTAKTYTIIGGRIRSLRAGMVCQIWGDATLANTGASGINTLVSTTKVFVEDVNTLAGTVQLRRIGGSDINLTASGYYDLAPYNPANVSGTNSPSMASGWIDWVKSTGTVFGVSLSAHADWRSLIASVTGQPLTGTLLNKYVGSFRDATGKDIDTIITTEGVLLGLLENIEDAAQLFRYEIQGEAVNAQIGFSDVGYRYRGGKIPILTTPHCPAGDLWGFRFADGNVRRYIPPRIDGTGTDSDFGSEVQFLAQLWGSPSIFTPGRDPTTGSEIDIQKAVYYFFRELAPMDPQTLRLTGLTEGTTTG